MVSNYFQSNYRCHISQLGITSSTTRRCGRLTKTSIDTILLGKVFVGIFNWKLGIMPINELC